MNHSTDFFKDEIRNGFYIPTALKVSWAASLDILKVIDTICSKHCIAYFADWGTILGAVRHGGFVPWDDDLDICMLREDYNRFRAVADDELPAEYRIHDYARQEDHWLFLSRVVNRNRISFDEEVLNNNYNFPWLSGVDIFIKDYLYPDPNKEKARCDEIMRLVAIADGITDKSLSSGTISDALDSIRKKYSVSLPPINDRRALSVALYALAEKQMARVNPIEAKEIGQIFPFILKGGKGEPKEFYESLIRIPFEDTTIPVPAQYNKVLTSRYGNYNEIRKVWSGHTYPAFEGQKEQFETSAGVSLPHFTYDPQFVIKPSIDSSSSVKVTAKECHSALTAILSNAKNLINDNGDLLDPTNSQQLIQNLGDMQQLAVDLGTLIENVKGENNAHAKAIVATLEQLCEDIYNAATAYNESRPLSNKLDQIKITLDKVGKALTEHLFSRREVLFLPIGDREWIVFSKIYDRLSMQDDVDVIVVPIPIFTKDYYGRPTMSMDDIRSSVCVAKYPEYLPIQDWETYDIVLHCPESVYIQFPYDNENIFLTVPQAYFSKNLRSYTKNLLYVPIGKTSEFGPEDTTDQSNLKYYVTAPALVYSDTVIVQSENIKEQYTNVLTEFAGESTRHIWLDKIQVDESIFEDSEDSHSAKISLLYCINLYEFTEHPSSILNAICTRLDTLTSQVGKFSASLCFYPDAFNCSDATLQVSISNLKQAVTQNAKERGIETIPLPATELYSFVQNFDAYYGSSSPLVHIFTQQNKPVMISNYDI